MKKFICLILSALMGCSLLVGCGGGGNVMHTATVDDFNGRLTRKAADLTVTFEYGGYGAEWICELKNNFQKETGKTVYIEGEKGISEYAATYWQSGGENCSDVFFVENGRNPLQQIALGYVEDISSVFEEIEDVIFDSYKDYGKVTTATYDGYYYLPWTITSGTFLYNSDILDDAGWTDPPETYAELLELVDDINNLAVNKDNDSSNDIYPFAWAGQNSNYWDYIVKTWFVQLIGINNYNEYAKMENLDYFDKTKTWTNPDTGETVNFAAKKEEALSLLEGLVVDPSTKTIINTNPTFVAKDYIFVQPAFAEGQAAMIPNGGWMERELLNSGIPEEKLESIRVMSVPFAPNAKKDANDEYIVVNNTLSYNYCMIPQKAAHKDLAKEFLEFSLTEENLKSFTYESYGFRPFKYQINKASLTFCAQDIYDIVQKAEVNKSNILFNPKSELAFSGMAAEWYFNPFSNMLTGSKENRKSASQCISQEFLQAKDIWASYLSD